MNERIRQVLADAELKGMSEMGLYQLREKLEVQILADELRRLAPDMRVLEGAERVDRVCKSPCIGFPMSAAPPASVAPPAAPTPASSASAPAVAVPEPVAAPAEAVPVPRADRTPTVQQAIAPYVANLMRERPDYTAEALYQRMRRDAGNDDSPFSRLVQGRELFCVEPGKSCGIATVRAALTSYRGRRRSTVEVPSNP